MISPISFAFIEHGSSDYRSLVALRELVLRHPLSLSFSPEELEREKNFLHIGGQLNGSIVASAMLVPMEGRCKMQRIAIRPDMQGQKVGTALMTFFEQAARDNGFSEIFCHSRETAIPFYLKHGYHTEGDTFIEQTIPHKVMRKHI